MAILIIKDNLKIVNSKKFNNPSPATHTPSHPNPHPTDEHHIRPFPYSTHTLPALPGYF